MGGQKKPGGRSKEQPVVVRIEVFLANSKKKKKKKTEEQNDLQEC